MMEIEKMDPAQAFEAKLLTRLKPTLELTAHGTSPVQQFYNGTSVFLTGGSGFIGKQLIEKLLRATNISKIFVLMRSKKGKTIKQRLNEILQDPLYDTLRAQKPDFAERIVLVPGDISELRLGLSKEDWNTVTEQTDFVFHVAATTKFDELLHKATIINVRGTRETLILAKDCKKLRSYVYVSTAFTHTCVSRVNADIAEDFYKSPVPPDAMIQLAESVDVERLNDITMSLIKDWPNTYSFTKTIAEELVRSMTDDVPACVVRPAIVISTIHEPTPGWADVSCINGASGMITACGLGVMHTIYEKANNRIELIPVDYVNNAVIAAAWETAKNGAKATTKIYTVSSTRNPVTNACIKKYLCEESRQYTTPMVVMYNFNWPTDNFILFTIYSWLLHLIPAYIMDGISVIIGHKRRFAILATKMYARSLVLSYFLFNNWNIIDKNTANLYESLSKVDQEIFNFDATNIDWKEYTVTWTIGIRKYILKDGLKDTLYARKKTTVLKVLTFIILPLYFYCLFKILCIVFSLFRLFW